ncbi:DUF4147 domain-containing protein [Balneolaceae bacterium ANBcel3]|nr:DUF4147 domain-containing protein [Balneolaceae bacterium ANBcel3]
MKIYEQQHRDIQHLFFTGLKKMDPGYVLDKKVRMDSGRLFIESRSYDLNRTGRIFVFGSGKAAAVMAKKLEDILGDKIAGGCIVCPYGCSLPLNKIEQMEAAHPVPDENSVKAAGRMIEEASETKPKDLILYLLSGGTSSLLCLPTGELELEDVQELYHAILRSGAPIRAMNRIRTFFSGIKGGKLRRYFPAKTIEMLTISDVPEDDPTVIGSAPLLEVSVDITEIKQLLNRYGLEKELPRRMQKFLDTRKAKIFSETGEKNKQQKPHVTILASAGHLARIIRYEARLLGYHSRIHDSFLTGESREVAMDIVKEALRVRQKEVLPAALVYYGETTVTVKGTGKGGRNQELALQAGILLDGNHYITCLSAGTDGRDGETEAAGAVVNGQSCTHWFSEGLDPGPSLENNDSWTFLNKSGNTMVTGPTGNNLMDIQIVLINA